MDWWLDYGGWCCLADLDKKMKDWAEAFIAAALLSATIVWAFYTIIWAMS